MADWKEQSLQVWNKISKRQRYAIIGVAALLILSILGWSYWWGGKPDMVPLFTGMETKDAGEVAAKLKEMKIAFEPQEGINGTAILVQAKDVHSARLELATLGLPRGAKGFEIFDDMKMGVTEFQNKVNYLRALQGELKRTIEQMSGVERAEVHIVLPEDSLYKKNEKPATASIMLKLRPGAQISPQQIKGIVNLAAHSIQGLSAENITVVDDSGNILNDNNEDEKGIGSITLTQLEMTKKIQERLQRDVQTLLDDALGVRKALVRLNVELDFDQRTTDRQAFTPVVEDSGIVRSEQQTTENYSGTSAAPGGPAGTAANIPGYVAANNNTESQYDKKEVTKNYEINETKEKIVATPGAIKRLSIAVLVDGQTISQPQQESISKLVSSAVGLDTERGDTISVEPLPIIAKTVPSDAMSITEQPMFWPLAVLGALAIIGAIAFMLRRRSKLAQAAQEQAELEEKMALQAIQSAAAVGGQELTPEEEAQRTERQLLDDMVRSRPEEVAQLVKTWLADE